MRQDSPDGDDDMSQLPEPGPGRRPEPLILFREEQSVPWFVYALLFVAAAFLSARGLAALSRPPVAGGGGAVSWDYVAIHLLAAASLAWIGLRHTRMMIVVTPDALRVWKGWWAHSRLSVAPTAIEDVSQVVWAFGHKIDGKKTGPNTRWYDIRGSRPPGVRITFEDGRVAILATRYPQPLEDLLRKLRALTLAQPEPPPAQAEA